MEEEESLRRARRRSTIIGVTGIVLIIVSVLFSLGEAVSDVLTTVGAIVGFGLLIWGIGIGVTVVMERFRRDE